MNSLTLRVAAVVVLWAAFLPIDSASADSIYLRNGRVIRADNVRVVGNQVFFYLHGAEQAIPLGFVDRVAADDWPAPTELPRAGAPSGSRSPGAEDSGSEPPPAFGDIPPAARMDVLSQYLGNAGQSNQALGLLQMLGGMQGGGGTPGIEALLPLLGALGSGGGALGGGSPIDALGSLGSLAADLDQIQTILPALTRLGAALFASEYSVEATDAAARELLQGLADLGVSDAEIKAKARQFGVPEDILARIRRR